MADLIGKTLGGYQIVEQIGRGGMATVYKAYQPSLDRDVAVKVLPPFYAEQDESFITRFRREARAIAKLRHPNILMVMDFGEKDDLSYIIMEYVDAGTMKDRLTTPIALSDIYALVKQIASALDYAHSEGVVHRDIKPSNILMPKPDWALLTDFGLAKMVGGSMLTQSGMTVGTPAYMSPEQGSGNKIDARTDIYALGVMLYEMVVGEVPYTAETPMAVVVKHIVDPLPMPRAKNPDIPEELQRVILKSLAKDPNDRFQKAGEIVEALEPVVKASPDWSASEIQTVSAIRTEIEDRPSTKVLTEETAEAVPPTLPTSLDVGIDPGVSSEETTPQEAIPAAPTAKKRSSLSIIAVIVVIGVILVGILQDPIRRMFSEENVSNNEDVGIVDDQPGDDKPGDDEFEFESPRDAFEQGRRFIEIGDGERAIRIFKIALDKNPELYWDLKEFADEIYNNGDVKLAIDLMVEVALPSQEELDLGAYEWVGWMYIDIGRPQKAQEFFTTVITNDPGFEDAYWGFYNAFISANQERDAINILEGLKEEYPGEFNVFYNLGELYYILGEDKKALENYVIAIEIRPDDHWLLISTAQSHAHLGNINKAIEFTERAIEAAPRDGGVWDSAASIYKDLGEYERAEDAFRTSIDLWPDYEWAYIGLVETLMILDKGEDEIPDLLISAERYVYKSGDLWAMSSLAWIYYDLGDCDKAVEIFNRALEIDPRFGEALDGLEACRER